MRDGQVAPKNEMVFLKDYQPTPYLITEVFLNFFLDKEKTEVRAEFQVRPRSEKDQGVPLVLQGDALELLSLSVNAKEVTADNFSCSDGLLTLTNPPKGAFTLSVVTTCRPEANKTLMGLYYSDAMFCTQCEPEGFRRITYFLDRPDVMSIYRVRIEADKTSFPYLLSNGNKVSEGDLPQGKHFVEWHDPHPKPCYLFALVAGDLGMIEDHFHTMEGRDVTLRVFVSKGKEAQADWAMQSIIRSMKWDEEVYGRAYDLDLFMLVAVSAFNFGAMENKGLNIFNDKLVLADPESATDRDYLLIERVVAHEYFHNWTGDRVTCRDWFQLCVKEGLTVYRDSVYTGDMYSRAVSRINDINMLIVRQWSEDEGPLAHAPRTDRYERIDNFYTATVYEKGAEIVGMLATRLGKERFRKGMDLYFSRHDNQAITVEDFLSALGDANGLDLMPFLAWYTESGTPIVDAKHIFDADQKTFQLTLSPKAPEGPAVSQTIGKPIPLKLALLDQQGREVTLPKTHGNWVSEDTIELTDKPVTITLPHQTTPLVPSLLRAFSAPVKMQTNLTFDERLHLFSYDSDDYVRYESVRQASIDVTVAAIEDFEAAKPAMKALAEAQMALCQDKDADPAFIALLIGRRATLSDLFQVFKQSIPLDAIFLCVDKSRDFLAPLTAPSARECLVSMPAIQEPYHPGAKQSALRQLRATLLSFIASARTDDALAIVRHHYEQARNLTDRLAALSSLCHHDLKKRDDYLADFRKRLGKNPLVFDHYARCQASLNDDQHLERLKQVMKDPLYDALNPNRVRALVGAFMANHNRSFHKADGSGYAFVLDEIERIDSFNSMLSSRMVKEFEFLPRLDDNRRHFITERLRAFGENSKSSAQIRELIGKLTMEAG